MYFDLAGEHRGRHWAGSRMTWRARGATGRSAGRSLTVTAPGPCGPVLRRDTARLPSRAAQGRGPRCRSGGTSCHRLPRPRLLCRAAWRRGLARTWAAVCRLPAGAAARRHPRRHHRRPADPDGQFADLPGHVVASARAAGLIYTQHIVLVHTAIRDSQLDPHSAAVAVGVPGGCRIHTDLLIAHRGRRADHRRSTRQGADQGRQSREAHGGSHHRRNHQRAAGSA